MVVHAAAGGAGSLAVQLAREAGARVIAAAGNADKREVAAGHGAHATVDARLPREQLTAALVEAGEGRGVDVVLDAVGGEVFAASLAVLAPFGRLVSYGAAGGRPAPVEPFDLTAGSKGVRPRGIETGSVSLQGSYETRRVFDPRLRPCGSRAGSASARGITCSRSPRSRAARRRTRGRARKCSPPAVPASASTRPNR